MITYFLPGFFIALAVLTLIMAVAAFFMRRGAAENARAVYAARRDESPASLRGLSEDQFNTAFLRAHGPRGQIFMTCALAGVLILTPAALFLLDFVWRIFWLQAKTPAFYAPGVLMWQFYMFFALIGVWVLIAGLAARLYHRRAGLSLEDEIIREAAK